MKNTSLFQISAFPKGERIWRISWLGKFVKNPNVPSEPSIEVVLVPLRTDINPENSNLNSKYAYDYSGIKTILVGSGLLPILKIGSFWQNRSEIRFKDPHTIIKTKFSINKDASYITNKIITPGLFQSSHYPEIDECNYTKLLVLDYPENSQTENIEKIIIPCNEVFRFYYAHSSQLTRTLLTGQLNGKTNNIYDPEQSYCNDGIGHVQLCRSIPDLDAAYVARLAFSSYAKTQATNIYTSGLKNEQNSKKFLIEALLPFEGESRISFEGKYVASPLYKKGWNFLVFQIKSCSYPFPFTQLTFSRDNDGRSIESKEDKLENGKATPKVPLQTISNNTEANISNQSEPSANLEITELVFVEDSFPDLIGKKIVKADKQINSHKGTETQFIKGNSEGEFSTGEGTYGKSKFKPIAVVRNQNNQETPSQKRQTALPANFNNFSETIAELGMFDSITYRYLQLKFDENVPSIEECSYFPTVNSWAYIDLERGNHRQFMTVEISYFQYYFYFFEIETDSAKQHDRYSMFVVHNPNLDKVDEDILKNIISICTKNHGRWLNNTDLRYIERKKFKHTSKDTEQCAKKFYLYMENFVAIQDSIKQKSSVTTVLPNTTIDIDTNSSDINSDKIA